MYDHLKPGNIVSQLANNEPFVSTEGAGPTCCTAVTSLATTVWGEGEARRVQLLFTWVLRDTDPHFAPFIDAL